MSLTVIGPVALDFHGNPQFSWTSAITPIRARGVSIAGLLEWAQAEQLSELIDNPDRRVPYGAAIGVLEPVFATDEYLSPFNGLYLLTGVSIAADQPHSLPRHGVPVTVTGLLLGSPRPMVVHSDRDLSNPFAITGRSYLAEPYYGDVFTDPPGSVVELAYDPDPHDSTRVSVATATKRSYVAAVGAIPETNPLAMDVDP